MTTPTSASRSSGIRYGIRSQMTDSIIFVNSTYNSSPSALTQVQYWITFNEPFVACWLGYGINVHAPGIGDNPGSYPYQCAHNVIRSHAKAWHLYNDTYRQTHQGKSMAFSGSSYGAYSLMSEYNALQE